MPGMINIKGLPKARVLAALYAAAYVDGQGNAHAAPDERVEDEATALVHNRFLYVSGKLYFRQVDRRRLNVNLTGDEFDPTEYDKHNGGHGTAKTVICELRARLARESLARELTSLHA